MNFRLTRIPALQKVSSLCWQADHLVDRANGGARYYLDGSTTPASVLWGYKFNAAVQSPSGRYAVIYERLGTKGLILEGCKLVREINRSFYHAGVYEYPVALFSGPDGRELIVHCPDEYCQLEVEDVATGERLTGGPARKPSDFFHSRLAVSANGRWLLSAGWIWHPLDLVVAYDLPAALNCPGLLDKGERAGSDIDGEINTACFYSDSNLLVAANPDAEDFENTDCQGLPPGHLGVLSLTANRMVQSVKYDGVVGTMMPWGADKALSFHRHPKVIDLSTGAVIHAWPELNTGEQSSSIIRHIPALPPLAMDPAGQRFAVASPGEIVVIEMLGGTGP